MRILLIEPSLTDNGALRVSLDRARRWIKLGATVEVLIASHDIAEGDSRISGFDDLPLVFATEKPIRLRYALPAAYARGAYLASKADVIVAGREIDTGLLIAGFAAKLTRRKYAVNIQSNVQSAIEHHVPKRLRRLTKEALLRADLQTCTSNGLVAKLVDFGCNPECIKMIYNGIDASTITKAVLLNPSISLPIGPFIVSSGRLTRQKGFDLLIRAYAEALQISGSPHSLIIMGDGPDRPALEALAAELDVAESVTFPGHVANPHAVVARADLFVLPSRWEGFALSLAEALCVGTPTIAADCVSGPSEVLNAGAYGKLVAPEDVKSLTTAIVQHFENPKKLLDMALRGQAENVIRFDPDNAAQQHLHLLSRLAHR